MDFRIFRDCYIRGVVPLLRELTEEERQQILHSADFQSFFDCSIRVMERALAEDSHIYYDYSGRDHHKDGDVSGGSSLSFSRVFYDEHWSKHRVITCLDWSPQYPELLVASYNNNDDAPHEPDGVALVWNIKFKKSTPEYIFHCQSPVVSVGFARFHPNLVVGGTYSGQIVLWDNRSHRRTPVQRTPHAEAEVCVGEGPPGSDGEGRASASRGSQRLQAWCHKRAKIVALARSFSSSYITIHKAKVLSLTVTVLLLVCHSASRYYTDSDSCQKLLSSGHFVGSSVWQPDGCMMHNYSSR
ncbi:cytoplasmic dynein 1 intermediate chain 1-like [Boleophthalmus pectinirostris]|uniref:cytoplasmic dynein 1 intermediate chain 1-like n=1 Tax=Boleophthalmus pectinirostris TaxID=150288 RepID=UPI00242CD81B|nr:cytoplasmic dynein 1 intermediate chain 1-like [Boleophthalmus pectinirostris]